MAGQSPATPSGPPPGGQVRRHLLADVRELASILDAAAPITVLDVRWSLVGGAGRGDHEASHVPGGAFVDLDRELAGVAGPGARRGRHPMPEISAFGASMRRAGVSQAVPVVCYDDGTSTAAARCWWLLRYFGHEDVRVLDGGFRAWERSGGPVEAGAVAPEEGDFLPVPGHMVLLDGDEAALVAQSGLLLDARSGERYEGLVEPYDPAAGHIPGAVSAPAADNLAPDCTFLPTEVLRRRFEGLGAAGGSQPLGAYCGSGVTAAHEVLSLEIAGFSGAGLYIGSWSEWSRDPSRPVATGAAP